MSKAVVGERGEDGNDSGNRRPPPPLLRQPCDDIRDIKRAAMMSVNKSTEIHVSVTHTHTHARHTTLTSLLAQKHVDVLSDRGK